MRFRIAAVIGPALIGILTLITAVFVLAAEGKPAESRLADQSGVRAAQQDPGGAYFVMPAYGSSWLKYLGVYDLRFSAMGEMGGNGPPPPSPRVEPGFPLESAPPAGGMGMGMGGMMGGRYDAAPRFSPSEIERMMGARFTLAGIDLFRLNCQSCHGPNGKGAPPEIKSNIGPFEGTSPALLQERMKKLGRPIGEKLAKELASQAEQSILQRLENGGKSMPPFRHLQGEEVRSLMQYLKARVRAPEARGKEILVTESVSRVGEHLVKGTCQICHDATGPGMGRNGMMRGIIPSLASFPYERSMQSVVWQVAFGSRRMMMGGQRMPAYPYITPDEAAAAYLYLVQYPPYAP
ncbi:MAG: c-type cytochrome [Desulfatiglandaceae bacterium]